MKRALIVILLGVFLSAGATKSAHAWSSPEHQAQGRLAFLISLAYLDDIETIMRLFQYHGVVANGSVEPDHCHSFWHSKTAHQAGVHCNDGPHCEMYEGETSAFLNDWWRRTTYVLNTNENHFGAPAENHWEFWHELAFEAAERYRETGQPVCERLALGLEGFALHYLQDRTASGHAWTQSTSDFLAESAPWGEWHKDFARGCIHGQGTWTNVGLNCSGLGGLGGNPVEFGGAMSGTGFWTSDEGFGAGSGTQYFQTIMPAIESILHVTKTITCDDASAPHPDQTYVSNLDMCQTLILECCRGGVIRDIVCDVCQDAGGDDPDNQDLDHDEVYRDCNIGAVESEIPADSTNNWVLMRHGFNRFVEIRGDAGWLRQDSVARRTWAGSSSREIHPDAVWNENLELLELAGCHDIQHLGEGLRDEQCDEWPCDIRPTIYCLDDLPPGCGDDPCGDYRIHTIFEDNRCHCPTTDGDGICATYEDENVDNSDDCGPEYCGDGYCNAAARETFDACPEDCAKLKCGDAYCHVQEMEGGSDPCEQDCGGPSTYPEPATCTVNGPPGVEPEEVCDDGVIKLSEHCTLCTGNEGPMYPGIEECTEDNPQYSEQYFTTHECGNQDCVRVVDGGWCDGWCSTVEGCVPTAFGEPHPCHLPGADCAPAGPARDVSFTMDIETAGQPYTTDVRARNYIADDVLIEQRAREDGSTGGFDTSLLRLWRDTFGAGQAIYAILPATPDPFTLESRARRDFVVSVASVFNGLATFPQYSQAMLDCYDYETDDEEIEDPTLYCLGLLGLFTDTENDITVDGETCRVFQFGDPSVTVCVPEPCELRRTLFPLRLTAPQTVVDFLDLQVDVHDDDVVVEPYSCYFPVERLELCEHPDLAD